MRVVATLTEPPRTPKRVWRILLRPMISFPVSDPCSLMRARHLVPNTVVCRLPSSLFGTARAEHRPLLVLQIGPQWPHACLSYCFRVCLSGLAYRSLLALTGSFRNRNRSVRFRPFVSSGLPNSHLASSRFTLSCCRVPFLATTVLLTRSHVATLA